MAYYYPKQKGTLKYVYVSLALDMPCNVNKELDFFLWSNRHYLRKEIVCKQKSKGGLSVLSFESLNGQGLCRRVNAGSK